MTDEIKGNGADTISVVNKDLEGIPEIFHEVVKKYGRPMFALVMNAGIAQEGLNRIATLATKHQSKGGIQAAGLLGQAFNQISADYARFQGWDEGILAQCSRDIQLAFAGKIQVPGETPIIVLNS